MKQLNLNDEVKVKLTEAGIKILEDRHNYFLKQFGDRATAIKALGEFKAPKVDENGYSSFQLWELMNIFGQAMYNGNPNIPFEMNIAIDDKYLVEQTNEKGKSL